MIDETTVADFSIKPSLTGEETGAAASATS
jgi:hypothetical protein